MKAMSATWIVLTVSLGIPASLQGQPTRDDVLAAMKQAAGYYRQKVASHGGYVYYYRPDLGDRWGEGRATRDTIFVQPPGTPTVGLAYLNAYAATRDPFFLDAARETAEALAAGQLVSGGWTQVIHFAPPARGKLGKYRLGQGGSWNVSSLDDGQTQTALIFLMKVDQALGFKNATIHDAASYGLATLLKAQFPNGGFPQVWTGPVAAKPIVRASFPSYDWKTEGRVKNYWDYYTLNDDLGGSVAETLITAKEVYQDDKYLRALEKLGSFLLLAQMPEPQPGWCQQYSYEMVPIWARKFEPPAISGSESQDAMRTLIRIANLTGQKRYLEPIPRALRYFEKNLLPDGRVARFYELKTNKPLYMDAAYRLTYDDSAAPGHYGWKQPAHFDQIAKAYQTALKGLPPSPGKPSRLKREAEVTKLLAELDSQGRWLSTYSGERLVGQPPFAIGFQYLSSAVFSRNLTTLADYLELIAKP